MDPKTTTKKRTVITVVPELQGADAGADRDWLESIPETFTPKEGYEAADRAVRFAKKAVREVAWSYQGTTPPPPWPAHPELQKAIANMEKVRDFFEVVDEKLTNTGKSTTFPKVSNEIKTGPTLVRLGKVLYDEVAKLQGWNARSATLDDMLKLVPRPGTILFGLQVGTIAGLAIAAYALSPTVRRWVGKIG